MLRIDGAATGGTSADTQTWIVAQPVSTAATFTTTINITSGNSAATNIWATTVWTQAGTVYIPDENPQPLNHRGRPIRSHQSDSLFANVSPAEVVALQLLRRMVSPEQFRQYLRHGFVSVRASSGLVYQVPRFGTIQVWDRGERIASLCVHLKLDGQTAPPTDHVVGKMLIIEHNEPDIWRRSNISWHAARNRQALVAVGQAA